MHLFLAALGLHCCMQAFSSCSERGPCSSCSVQASHCGGFSCCRSQALGCTGFCSCGTRAQLLLGIWDLPRPGIEPRSAALAVGFQTTGPPGKSKATFFEVELIEFSRYLLGRYCPPFAHSSLQGPGAHYNPWL